MSILLAHSTSSQHDPTSPLPPLPLCGDTSWCQHLPVLASTRLLLSLSSQAKLAKPEDRLRLTERDPVATLHLLSSAALPVRAGKPQSLPFAPEAAPGDGELWDADYRQQELDAERRHERASYLSFAEHSFAIATLCREVASTLGLGPEEAFLIGLLHEIGDLPLRLGRQCIEGTRHTAAERARLLCEHFCVPLVLQQALYDVHDQQPGSIWNSVVQAAHELMVSKQPLLLRAR